jgi:manganese/zinc/iron transport system permease protein
LPGNFLILRRQALIGDAISHVVLPGIVVAFLLTGLVAAMPMLLGAAGRGDRRRHPDRTGQARRPGRTGCGDGRGLHHPVRGGRPSVGAVGHVVGASRCGTRADGESGIADLAVGRGLGVIGDPAALAALPPELPRMALVRWIMVVLTAVFWRWLKIATFDEGFAEALGIPAAAVGFGLVIAAALGRGGRLRGRRFHHRDRDVHLSRPATARLMTSNLRHQVLLVRRFRRRFGDSRLCARGVRSLVAWRGGFGQRCGMIATVSGAASGLACLFGPHRKPGRGRRRRLTRRRRTAPSWR